MASIDNKELARLIKACAEALNNEDGRSIAAGEQRWKGVAGEWSTQGRKICDEVAGPIYGEIVYYLLGGAWNDVLDWAERQ